MKEQELIMLLRLRMAVYRVGCEKKLWPCLEDNAAKEYMHYLFPKSSTLAFYNLMINIVQKKHEEHVPSEMYDLFHCPIQLEEEMLSFLKKNTDENLWTFNDGPLAYIKSLSTVSCESSMCAIYIGQLSDNIESALRVIAYYYNIMLSQNYNCIPYFN